ncbi:uncharacterized protein [Montipora capricornis]|uniref:uncharacterized protein n=1 Tax=Montipora capricornis TaxID=246305 RepID=UPI0035F1568E
MDCSQYKSVVSLVECLVRSAHAKSSRGHDAVSSKQFTDFSIRSILGLENDVTADTSSDSEYHSTTSSSLSPYSDRSSPPTSHRQTSAELPPYSDISSSGSDCDSEPDRMPKYTAQAPREKRQRTTFSPNEVMQLEQAFSQRPYLTQYDEKMLAQRIGITDKNVRYWFQNRRAKSRRFRREVSPVCQTTLSNCFEPIPNSRSAQPRGLRAVNQSANCSHEQVQQLTCAIGSMATQSTSVLVAQLRRSPNPSHTKPTLTSVSHQQLSFSISNILGLEDDRPLSQASSNSVSAQPLRCFAKSPSLYSDITSSSSDCDSEYDQIPIPSEKSSKKRRQRTTFSAQEVWAMERAFKRSPYIKNLRGEDEMDLVQRLGIPVESLKFWFQNRRAKAKREKRDKPGVRQASLSNRLECPASLRLPVHCHPYPSSVSEVAHIKIERVWSEAETDPKEQPRFYAPVVEGYHDPNQFRLTVTDPNDPRIHSFGLPMFYPDRLKYRKETQPARKWRYSRASNRFQPYYLM